MQVTTLTRKEQISKIRQRTKLLLETLLGIDRALDDSPRHARFRANLLDTRIAIGETNQQLHTMDDEELAQWAQTIEDMIGKIKAWLNQAPATAADTHP